MKPGFFQNDQLAELPVEARLLFLGLTLLADREGRLEDRPKRIKMQIFPADLTDVEPLLQGLQDHELIVRYTVEGRAYIWIPTFTKHQKPHPREATSVIPPCPGDDEATPRHGRDNTKEVLGPAESLNPESLNGDKKETRANGARVPSRHIDLVFRHWQEVHEHPQAKCTEKRRRLIALRLKDGYTLEQLRECIDGYRKSPFHRGDNPAATKYDSIELMLRDAKQVEQGMEFHRNPPKDVNRGTRRQSAVERAQRATGGARF